MAQFATAAEFADRLGITLTGAETTRANALLVQASGLIQSATGQDIEAVTNDTLTRQGIYGQRLRLPQRPVNTIDSVTLDGVALVPDDGFYREGDELVRDVGWGGPEAEIVVQYDHGYSSVPGAVKSACLEMVARVWVNPGAVQQEGYGTEQVSYVRANGMLLTPEERRVVRDAVSRTVGSVGIR